LPEKNERKCDVETAYKEYLGGVRLANTGFSPYQKHRQDFTLQDFYAGYEAHARQSRVRMVAELDDPRPGDPVCGEACAVKKISEWMSARKARR